MNKYIAFLRAINVGGRRLKMDELRAHFEAMGFENVETFIASGNVIFDVGQHDAPTIEAEIQTQLQARLGYAVTTFVRTTQEVAQIAAYQPFATPQMQEAQALNVALLAAPLTPEQATRLPTLRTDIDDFHHHAREVYWLCRAKQSESKFSNATFERALKIEATFRTINTFVRLAAKYKDEG